ncbi:MAG: endonuclease/exonuclease/phosphatase family protein [Armatimonadetes bacterium]|nr:endonuclease/exonuclease/phosphatase family protein [Armatimonadota bacterium]
MAQDTDSTAQGEREGRRIPHCAPRWARRLRLSLLSLSLALCAALAACYALRPDACAAVTLFPVWAWLAPGLVLAWAGWGRAQRRFGALVLLAWLGYLVAFAEEPRSLVRGWLRGDAQGASRAAATIRVVSLNCAGGSEVAAAEVAGAYPDIVLLQESPGRAAVEALGRRLFGAHAAAAWSRDESVLARGALLGAAPSGRHGPGTRARVRLASGTQVDVVSVRFVPPVARMDLWNPSCWRDQAANRRARRDEVRSLAGRLAGISPETPLVVGGDFNAPAGDATFRLLRPRLRDTFREAGLGWGNTAVNDFPFHRIDQIWISRHFRAVAVTARKTQHSDHRMVVCDMVRNEGQ